MKFASIKLLIIFLATLGISPISNKLLAQNNTAPVIPVEPTVVDPDVQIDLLLLTDETAIQVIDLLEQMTGKIILRRQDLPPTKINFNSRGPIKKSEAILALESLLSLNGIMLTDMGGRFLKAVPASNPSSQVPNMLSGSSFELPASQQVYAKLFKLNYLVADQTTLSLINPLLSPNNSLITFPKSNALLITDSLINLQRIETILKENDQPQVIREHVEFIKLKFVQAKDMESQLRSLIDGSLKSYLQGNSSITIDERTNQLILVTHPGNLALIQSVIDNIDIDAAPLTASEVFPLKQAKAEEVVKIIDEIITGQRKGREDDAKTAKNDQPKTDTPENLKVSDASEQTNLSSNASLQFSEFVGLSADERTNSIVAYGTQQDLKTLETLIEKIDIPLPQVRIEAIITEVGLTENQNSGLSTFEVLFQDNNSTSLPGDDILSLTNKILSTGDNPILFEGGKLSLRAILDITETESNVKVLSTPSIVVSHNEEGNINISTSRPIVTGSQSSTINSTSVRSSIEYRDIGIELNVTPLIGADGSVQMEIEQSADTYSEEDDVTLDQNKLPVIGKRTANSTITVDDGEIAVLAGLQKNTVTDSRTIFPLIGRIPLIKNIFSPRGPKYARSELIIFIRPTVIRNSRQSDELNQNILDKYEEGKTIKKYLETGTIRDIYMEGSRLSPKKKED